MRRAEGRGISAGMAAIVTGALLAAALGGCAGPVLAPTPNLYWATGDHPFDDLPESKRTTAVEMLYATDRVPLEREDDDDPLEYGHGRSHSMAFGTCTVQIGDDMTWEELVEASTEQRRRRDVPLSVIGTDELVRVPASNRQTIVIDGMPTVDPDYVAGLAEAGEKLNALLREKLAAADRKEIFIFVHGYNNTFDDAALRMAQMWHFMGRPGVALFYSWPAGHPGLLQGYTYDRESSEFTIFHLKQVARLLRDSPDVERVSLVAHSRGTDVALSAMRELWIERRTAGRIPGNEIPPSKLGSFVIAASDLDWDVFQQRISAERLGDDMRQVIIYLSEEDKAIGASQWLFGSLRRLGRLGRKDLTPEQQELLQATDRVQVIDARVRSGFLGHAYFITNPAVLSDLILVLRDERPPGADHGRPLGHKQHGFWTLTDSYLTGRDPSPTTGGFHGGSRPSSMNPNPR